MSDQQPRQPIAGAYIGFCANARGAHENGRGLELTGHECMMIVDALDRLAEYESRLPRNAQGDVVLPGDELHEYDPRHGPMMCWADMREADEVVVPGDADYGPMDFSHYHRTPELAKAANHPGDDDGRTADHR